MRHAETAWPIALAIVGVAWCCLEAYRVGVRARLELALDGQDAACDQGAVIGFSA